MLKWARKKENYGVALSNPNFEYWLLLHCQDVSGDISVVKCSRDLKSYWPEYKKKVPQSRITLSNVEEAIERARMQHNLAGKLWPRTTGTTVYKLVELMIANKQSQS